MAASLLASSILGVRGWGTLSAPLRIQLEALELTDPVGFRGLFDGSKGEAERVALHFGGAADDAAVLMDLCVWAGGPAAHLERQCSQVPTPSVLADMILQERAGEQKRRRIHVDSVQQALSHSLKQAAPVATGTGSVTKWPTKLRRSLALAGSATARETAERAERDRWVREVRAVIVAADLPVLHVSSLGSALQDVAQGRRARTLRKRVNDFAKLSRYCAIVSGKSWPHGVGMVLDFLASLAEGGHRHQHCILPSMRYGSWSVLGEWRSNISFLVTRWWQQGCRNTMRRGLHRVSVSRGRPRQQHLPS